MHAVSGACGTAAGGFQNPILRGIGLNRRLKGHRSGGKALVNETI